MGKKVLLPSSNCSLILESGRRVVCQDAVLEVDDTDSELQEFVQGMILAGNAMPFDDIIPLAPAQTPVKIGDNGVAK